MESFLDFYYRIKNAIESREEKRVKDRITLFEHEIYKQIPGEQASYRIDKANTNAMTIKHCHVFAKTKGNGNQLYAANVTGSGHDGYQGYKISDKHANYFRSIGFNIPSTNILESIDLFKLDSVSFSLVILYDESKRFPLFG